MFVKDAGSWLFSLQRRTRLIILVFLILIGITAVLSNCQQTPQTELARQPAATTAALADAPTKRPPTAAPAEQSPQPTTTVQSTVIAGAEPAAKATMEVERTPEPMATGTKASRPVEPAASRADAPKGALISVKMESKAGVLLDELPETIRDQAVDIIMARPASFWEELARKQVQLTKRRLNFRNFAYDDKGQLPLPPEELWSIAIDPAGPVRETIDGHDLVTARYTFTSTLLTDAGSPGAAEPALAREGGKWDEPFILPVDPDLLLQRTGNACLNESGFPPNSFDSENAWVFFDFTCEGDSGGVLGCHRSRLHPQSCFEILGDRVGAVETKVQFEHLTWDAELADAVRVGELTHLDGPDLKVIGADLENNRVIYRYFPEDSCAIVEQCVSGSGWRRLLQFNATVHNVGAETMYIGPVVAENPIHNLFQYNACHAHYHFSDYGDFTFAGAEENLSSKQAFCVESTNRFSNNEWSPLTHDYTCRFQGVQAGWVDEYVAGLDCQWIDITDVEIDDAGESFTLGLSSNPDQFLCEGSLVLDGEGNPVWEASGLTTPNGAPVNRPQCDFVSDWDVNNEGTRDLFLLPAGSFVTEPCAAGLLSPLRNCGFNPQTAGIEFLVQDDAGEDAGADQPPAEVPQGAFACEPGQPVQLTCRLEGDADLQVARFCDYSAALETGVACTYSDALANQIVDREETTISFTCPVERDDDEPGGLYALYTTPLLGEGESQRISCIAR